MRDEETYWAWKADPSPENAARLSSRLRAFARILVLRTLHYPDSEIIGNIVSHAFLKESQFKGESKFTTWFYRVAIRECLQHLRRRRTLGEVSLDTCTETVSDTTYRQVEKKILVEQILQQLRPEQADLCRLRLSGMELAEMAEEMGITPAAAKGRWRRLVKQLRQRFAESY